MEGSSAVTWRTSSYSGNNGGNCIETATAAGRVLVRDTKDRTGAVLTFAPQTWREFAADIKNSTA